MDFYTRHVFFCINQKEGEKKCCMQGDAMSLWMYAKMELARLAPQQAAETRINKSGCLGQCSRGPVLVIYPEGVWYRYDNKRDIDEIIQRHILQGETVERLRLTPEPKSGLEGTP